jgi:hypothetical protein
MRMRAAKVEHVAMETLALACTYRIAQFVYLPKTNGDSIRPHMKGQLNAAADETVAVI